MYAVIETGGKQYRVQEGDLVDVEICSSEDSVEFDRVLMLGGPEGTRVGTPTVDGASVSATVVRNLRAPKVIVFKRKRRKGYRRRNGHRQNLQQLRIDSIKG